MAVSGSNERHPLFYFMSFINPYSLPTDNRFVQQKRHDYYGENKDRIKEYAKQWKQDHSSMVCVPKQEYFEKNKDKIKQSRRRKCAENKEQINHKKKNTEKLRKPKISQFEIVFPYSKVL